MSSRSKRKTRLNLEMSDDDMRRLNGIATRRGWSMSETIRRAIVLCDRLTAEGRKIYVEENGQLSEVILL